MIELVHFQYLKIANLINAFLKKIFKFKNIKVQLHLCPPETLNERIFEGLNIYPTPLK